MKLVAALLAAALLLPLEARAQLRTQVIATGFAQPVVFVPDPLFPDVFYVVEQAGLVKVVRNGQVLSEPFLDLRGQLSFGSERGLLGMAFAPDAASGRVFFNFTDVTAGNTVIARYTRTAASPFRVDASSRFDLAWPGGERFIRQPSSNHNGGNLVFGPDGYLYIALGDGGGGNDPSNMAQDPSSLLGKVLRIDVSVPNDHPSGYRVPADNPFLDGAPIQALAEIWAFGLRNPWRYSFDDVGAGATGALLIGDVGQNSREEVNYEPAGAGGRNYGWRIREGRVSTPGVPATTPAYGPLVDPIFDYDHSIGRAVTGGYVYRGTALGPTYGGRYFFADFVASRVWSLGLSVDPLTREATAADLFEHTAELGGSLGGVASFGRDLNGELYLLTFAGSVLRIVPDPGPVPNAPQNLTAVVSGSTVMVSWMPPASGPLPAGYRLEAGSVSGAADLGLVPAGASQTSLAFSNIPPGVYFVRVRSVGAAGVSSASNEVAVTVGGGCTQAPPAPTALSSTVNGRLVTLTWAVPTTANGPAQLVIEAGSTSGAANLAVLTVGGASRTLSVGAPPGTYFVRIKGVNGCGTSPPSNEIVVTVF